MVKFLSGTAPTNSEMTELDLRRQQRSFFARLTQPIRRARMSKLMLAKMGPHDGRRPPPGRTSA
jgi:hypothetical protein